MNRSVRCILVVLLTVFVPPFAAVAQEVPAETLDEVSEDVDILEQMNMHQFTIDQLQAMVPILSDLGAKHQALVDFGVSEEALAPMRALREALLKGEPTGDLDMATDPVWEKLMELEDAYEEAIAPAMERIAALLTDEQLTTLAQGDEWAYDEADEIFMALESAREFNDETYNAWADRQARQAAFRAAGESEEKAAGIQAEINRFFAKVRKLSEDDFMDQYDDLFDELHTIIADSQPTPIREVVEAQAADELEFIFRSPRAVPLVNTLIAARGEGAEQ